MQKSKSLEYKYLKDRLRYKKIWVKPQPPCYTERLLHHPYSFVILALDSKSGLSHMGHVLATQLQESLEKQYMELSVSVIGSRFCFSRDS